MGERTQAGKPNAHFACMGLSSLCWTTPPRSVWELTYTGGRAPGKPAFVVWALRVISMSSRSLPYNRLPQNTLGVSVGTIAVVLTTPL